MSFCLTLDTYTCNVWRYWLSRLCWSTGRHFRQYVDTCTLIINVASIHVFSYNNVIELETICFHIQMDVRVIVLLVLLGVMFESRVDAAIPFCRDYGSGCTDLRYRVWKGTTCSSVWADRACQNVSSRRRCECLPVTLASVL